MIEMKSILLFCSFCIISGLREFRLWSNRTYCEKAQWPNYPFAYSKYVGQTVEGKARVNTNLQDFRHECQVRGGRSKCHICEDIDCNSDVNKVAKTGLGTCALQLQGVSYPAMSSNIPIVSDTAWAVGGSHKHDYGGRTVTHFCVFLTGAQCILPNSADFHNCTTRCFGYGPGGTTDDDGPGSHSWAPFKNPARNVIVSQRSVVDIYPGMLYNDYQVDNWSYPRNCSELNRYDGRQCQYSGPTPTDFNPQGFAFTVAGSGSPGFQDGPNTTANFFSPQDLDLDINGTIYVADTLNNAIRMIGTDGHVTTVAGKGPNNNGYADGNCDTATFTNPKGIAVRLWEIFDETSQTMVPSVLIAVADTGNHRIRMIDLVLDAGSITYCHVRCFSGLCGNNTLSASLNKYKASPFSGYADGDGLIARFSAPQGIDFMPGGHLVVADTGNFLIRWLDPNGTATTLAGTVVDGEKDPQGLPLAGCPPPCMQGQQGFADGNLTSAQFYNPYDVSRGPGNSVFVADEQRIRIVELPHVINEYYSIKSEGRVSTLAGTTLQGREDGTADKSTFFDPMGVYVSADNIAYVADSSSCRIRRITPLPLVAEKLNSNCATRLVDIFRPSGCTSFDQAYDKIGRKVSRVEKNVQFNFGHPYENDLDRGKYIKNCVGVPPLDTLDKHFVLQTGDNLVIDDDRTVVNEDSEQGTTMMLWCPDNCASHTEAIVEGTEWYGEYSSICRAAIHSGVLPDNGGYIQIEMQRRDYLRANSIKKDLLRYVTGSVGATTRHYDDVGRLFYTSTTVKSKDITSRTHRVFHVQLFNESMNIVHTIGGRPSGPLESGCGFKDAQPPTWASFNLPRGVAALPGSTLTDRNFLYVADSGNHRIRAISAVCTQICENGGLCVAPDTCSCQPGWGGVDCTMPNCNGIVTNNIVGNCGQNRVCVAPNTCACKPGFQGANCDVPQCVQKCSNGGTCTAPDTCSCTAGWFDTNCTTPVCSQTCANGGNCTSPNTCACPDEWTGSDCRIPVCEQTCLNGGFCIAPNTCICPPDWINFDCSVPVCTQGYFNPNPGGAMHHRYATNLVAMPTYKQCDILSWCNATHEFECYQLEMSYGVIEVKSGPEYRRVTGRKDRPTMCMNIELPTSYKIPFELLNADGTNTGYLRYSPNSPYTSNPANPWRGYLAWAAGHTGPWTYEPDRQIANVNWLNVSQGVYVCANGGNCTSPGVCECAPGWIGYDCRTPVCDQGYYRPEQKNYVSGLETPLEVVNFLRFLGNNSYRLNWSYSNPSYNVEVEDLRTLDRGYLMRTIKRIQGVPYLGPSNWQSGVHASTPQGGYRCSIRSFTRFENDTFSLDHPNYYSRYMDAKMQDDKKFYTAWKNMFWPPVHRKSRILDQSFPGVTLTSQKTLGGTYGFDKQGNLGYVVKNHTYIFTNQGFRRWGIWNRTANEWTEGTCIMEFKRNCSGDPSKALDLESKWTNVYVQDTDLAYRPRVLYDDRHVYGVHGSDGRWKEAGGPCVDNAIRGCKNNGTCVAPNTCACAVGWAGSDCTIPVCKQTCHNWGNCTLPDTCTCERGWKGFDCSIPICAQECQNGGACVAPDTCQCSQWANDHRDGTIDGGIPLFQDELGNPLPTGWTGFDCATPICVQGERFYPNQQYGRKDLANPEENTNVKFVGKYFDPDTGKFLFDQSVAGTDKNNIIEQFVRLGGNGADGLLPCLDSEGRENPRCPDYDSLVTSNSGTSFQAGCGFDPFDSGCCVPVGASQIACYRCDPEERVITNHTFFCRMKTTHYDVAYLSQKRTADFVQFLDFFGNVRLCGSYLSPRYHTVFQIKGQGGVAPPQDYGRDVYYVELNPKYADNPFASSHNFQANYTSSRFLCQVSQWEQGIYNTPSDSEWAANPLSTVKGVGSLKPLEKSRHIRINYPNMIPPKVAGGDWRRGREIPGEGVYGCYNYGSCIAPDTCTCTDGYTGYDCKTPMCRHLRDRDKANRVTGCVNGGVCEPKDNCNCIQTESVLWKVHPEASKGITGWTGSDCSIPMCVQGYFDPFCTDLPEAPAGEGCFRCANGGNCTAPEVCTCAPGWTGYDCKTPVCEAVADPLTRTQLGTVFEEKVVAFESDPCGIEAIYGMHGFHGQQYARGNCTQPNQCTCLCKIYYNKKECKKTGRLCDGAWQDPMVGLRNLPGHRGPEYTFGTTDCKVGYEGNVDNMTRFTTCHQTVYMPTSSERSSMNVIISISIVGFFFVVAFYFARERINKQLLLAKIERRRTKRSSEESLLQVGSGAFVNK